MALDDALPAASCTPAIWPNTCINVRRTALDCRGQSAPGKREYVGTGEDICSRIEAVTPLPSV
jgi:hypothetical protein